MKTAIIAAAVTIALILPPLFAQDQTTIPASAPAGGGISPDVPQTHEAIKQWRGQYGDEKAHSEVITKAGDWAKLWKHLGLPSHEALDEKTQMGVCLCLGERPTTGFKPYIISAVERDGKLVVSWSSGNPARTELVIPEVTHPWVAALIPKSALPIVFKEI